MIGSHVDKKRGSEKKVISPHFAFRVLFRGGLDRPEFWRGPDPEANPLDSCQMCGTLNQSEYQEAVLAGEVLFPSKNRVKKLFFEMRG